MKLFTFWSRGVFLYVCHVMPNWYTGLRLKARSVSKFRNLVIIRDFLAVLNNCSLVKNSGLWIILESMIPLPGLAWHGKKVLPKFLRFLHVKCYLGSPCKIWTIYIPINHIMPIKRHNHSMNLLHNYCRIMGGLLIKRPLTFSSNDIWIIWNIKVLLAI